MRSIRLAILGWVAGTLALLGTSLHAEQFSNFALSTLANSIGVTDVSLTLSSTTNFPGSAPFRLTIQDSASSTPEIVLVTAVVGNTYTVTRGYEGTAASAHSSGAQVGQFVTAGVISALESQVGGLAPGGTNGQLQFNNSGAPGGFTASGDCTITPSTGVVVCTKTNGAAFAPSATTDTTNAGNIASGTLPAARLPTPGITTLGGVQSIASVAHEWINAISTSGIPSVTQPTASDISGLAASATTDTTNAGNITSGTLPSGRLPPESVAVKTSAYALVASDSGSVFANSGASGPVTFSLVAASAGLNACFIADAAQTIVVAADSGHTIRNGTSVTAVSGNLTSNGTKGEVVCVVALNSSEWFVSHITGTWGVN